MTPLEYGQELLDDLKARVLSAPANSYAQLGPPIIDCESIIVAATGADGQPLSGVPNCDIAQIGTYSVSIARDCSDVANEDGTTDVTALNKVSEQQDTDAKSLWEWAEGLDFFITKSFSVGWVITGGLAITTLTLTIGVP